MAKTAKTANGANGLVGGAAATDCRSSGNGLPARRQRVAGKVEKCPSGVWFVSSPLRLDQAARIARMGGVAVLVWLAVRAHADGARGSAATVAWIVEQTGVSERTLRHAAAALVEAGVLKRNGRKLSVNL